jgi:Growth-Arrest-Specific Protein 2 Domain
LDESYKSRRELQLSIEETTHQLSEMIENQDKIIKQYLKERDDMRKQLQEAENQVTTEKNKLSGCMLKIQELESESELYKPNETEKKTLEAIYQDSVSKSEQFLAQQSNLIQRLNSSTFEFQNRCGEYQSKLEVLINDKIILMKAIETLQKENHSLKRENDHLSSELLKLKSRLSCIESEITHQSGTKLQENELLERLKTSETLLSLTKEELNRNAKTFKEKVSKFVYSKNLLIQENKDILNKLNEAQSFAQIKDQDLQKALQDNNRLVVEIARIEQHLCVKEDSNQIIDDLQKKIKNLRQQHKETLNLANDQGVMIIQSTKKIEELENSIKEKSEEIEVLLTAVVKLQRNREIYAPAPNDPIDKAMADYINTLEDPLSISFTREEEGTYLFGTKRIFVKLEHGKIIIRVGGGYMQVNDFIEIYTPAELEKFARNKADKADKLRQSILGKFEESQGKNSPQGKFSPCYGIQKRVGSINRSSSSPKSHTISY